MLYEMIMALEQMKFEEKSTEKDELESLKREGERAYSEEFIGKLDEVLEHEFAGKGKGEKIVLKDTIDKHLKEFSAPEFSNLSAGQQAEIQGRFVKELVCQISKIPGDTWSFYFDRSLKTGKMNCSGCANLTALILESTKNITGLKSVEFGVPYSHALNIVSFGDGRFYYADSRNNVFEDLTDNAEIEEQSGLKIYKIKELGGGMSYKNIPVLSVKDGILNSYFGDLDSVYQSAKGKISTFLKGIYNPQQLAEIREEAKEICEEERLTKEKSRHLEKLVRFFGKKIIQYEKSKEFQAEIKRWEGARKIVDFLAPLKPVRDLAEKDEIARKELISRQDEVVSFLNFETDKLSLDNKQIEKIFKSFREEKKVIKDSNPAIYKESIQQIAEALKSLK